MTQPIIACGLKNPLDAVYQDPLFHLLIETHIPWLKQQPETIVQPVTPHDGYKYAYDLYGYLRMGGYPPEVYFATLRCSGLNSPTEFNQHTGSLYIASARAVDQLRQLHLTSRTVIGKK